MKLQYSRILLFLALTVLIYSCKTPIEPDFSYSPEAPRAGQSVSFTNLTETGTDWNWTFGDGGTSIAKNPNYIYKKPGIYDVTLRADSNDNYIVTRKITIYDTIPTIYASTDSVIYYEDVTFSVLAYNPYGYTITYEWEFSGKAQGETLSNGKSTDATVKVFFSERNVNETIKVKVQVGDSVYTVQKTVKVNDQPARSLLIAGADGKVYRQRLFSRGLEPVLPTNYTTGAHPFTIQARNNELYLFNAGSTTDTDPSVLNSKSGDGSIVKINMSNHTSTELVHNRNTTAVNGFFSGSVDGNYLYWSDFSSVLYRHPLADGAVGAFEWKGSTDGQTALPYYLVKYDRIGYFGNGLDNVGMSTGVYSYDFVYFWSKGGKGKGIYRFTASDILNSNLTTAGTKPETGSILNDYSIRSFAIDHINQKIYFAVTAPADKTGFWVSNLSGLNAVRIDDAPVDNAASFITGIAIDHVTNKVYWAYRAPETLTSADFEKHPSYRTGIKMVRLAKNYSIDTAVQYLSPGLAAYGISIDEVKKY